MSYRVFMKNTFVTCVLATVLICGAQSLLAAEPFVVTSGEQSFLPPRIVVQHDSAAGTGFDWDECLRQHPNYRSDKAKLRDAMLFLQEGVRKMTGVTLRIESDDDLSRGIVVTTLAGATPKIQGDVAVQEALRNDGSNAYNHREAFFIRSEKQRLLIVANTVDGLAAAVAELLESVDYEVLGMGPDWIHVPKKRRQLVFDLQRSGRPSFYIRNLAPMSGQANAGYGTLFPTSTLKLHAGDEHVATSHNRWSVGARIIGRSMPRYPGHALQAYHRAVAQKMQQSGSTAGFLVPATHVGLDVARPAASADNKGHVWINSDAKGQPGFDKVFMSDGKKWDARTKSSIAEVDLTVAYVREILLDDMKRRAEAHFAQHPDDVFIFGCEPEDGGADDATRLRLQHDGNWYPDYLRAEGLPFGRPYALHRFKGLNQPREIWDPASRSDMAFGCANWLLHEFDKWIESRPEAKRMTSTGRSKKELARCSLYSYHEHDVPPNFNLDPRIRLMVAGFPKHRGRGKWKKFVTHNDIAAAFQVMLPREPSGSYRILSFAYYYDLSAAGIPAAWSAAPTSLLGDLKSAHRAGIRSMVYETDFNFGKFGLAYYLLAKSLWNVEMTTAELTALRNRWLRRAFGSGWSQMKDYYDFMLKENYSVNGSNSWARAIRFIEAADTKIDPIEEPDAQRRLDDVKQYWYFHDLLQSGKANRTSPTFREFIWKGQQSYMVAMNAVVRKYFGEPAGAVTALDKALPESERQGPAHYTHDETQRWWKQVLEFWPLKAVTQFADTTLADSTKASDVDLNDLVRVKAFENLAQGGPFFYNSGYMMPARFLTVAEAGDDIGFKLFWPSRPSRDYEARDVSYGVERWNSQAHQWQIITDPTMAVRPSVEVRNSYLKTPTQLVEVHLPAKEGGVYRVNVGRGGNLALLASLGLDISTGRYASRPAHTYFNMAEGLTQRGVYLYLPKGTRSFDLETTDTNHRTITFYKGLPTKRLVVSRQVKLKGLDVYRVEVQP